MVENSNLNAANTYRYTYRADIDGLRALAVTMVVLFHVGFESLVGGFTGVDVFFVISGYLITRNILQDRERGSFTFKTFYLRRIRRLWPALAATIFATLVFSVLLFSAKQLTQNAEASMASIFSVANFYFEQNTNYFSDNALNKPLLHTWSLSVEEQFYLIWPLFVVFIIARLRAWTALLVLFVMFAGGAYLSELYLAIDRRVAFYWMPFRMFEFAAGAALVFINLRLPRWLYDALLVIGLGLILFSLFNITGFRHFPGIDTLYSVIGAALIILAGAHSRIAVPLRLAPIVWLGKISYSIYLVHWPLIVFYRYGLMRDLYVLESVGLVAVTILLGALLYYSIEKPFRITQQSTEPRQNWAVFGSLAAGSILVVSAVSVHMIYTNGWTWRLNAEMSAQIEEITSLSYETNCTPVADRLSEYKHCLANEGASNRIVLIGDSHATSLFQGYDDLGEELDLETTMIGLYGNLPLWGVRTFLNQRSQPVPNEIGELANFTRAHKYAENQKPDLVIIHARWGLGWNTHRPSREGVSRTYVVRWGKEDRRRSMKTSQQAIRDAVKLTFDKFYTDQQRVVVLGALPILGGNYAQCLNTPELVLSLEHKKTRCRDLTREQALARVSEVNDELAELLAPYPNVSFVDPVQIFCGNSTAEYCDAIEGDDLLYYDTNHLSRLGARKLILAIEELTP